MSEGQPIIINPSLRQFEVVPLGTPIVGNVTELPDVHEGEAGMAKTAGTSVPALHSSSDVNSKENIEPVQPQQPVGFVTVDPISGEPISAAQVETVLPPEVQEQHTEQTDHGAEEDEGINIVINNVVCSFSVRCHLNLKKIAMEGMNVIYKREHGMVSMKIRRPYTTASIWSSGKITVTGATSEDDSKKAARKYSRILQTLGFRVRFGNFRVVNVLGTCSLPFGIRITHFSRDHPQNASYEPELHPGVTYRIKTPKATLKIFSTGSITVTAPSVANIQSAIEHIFPLVSEYKMERAQSSKYETTTTHGYLQAQGRQDLGHHAAYKDSFRYKRNRVQRGEDSEDISSEEDSSDEDFDSDTSED